MKVALVYDRVNKWGGAERVLLTLHEMFPDAPLYTSVYNKKRAKWASVFSVIPSFIQNFPLAKEAHELYPLLMPTVFESMNFDEYDVVISVTSESAKGIITKPATLHICYCLTPTRYLWSGYTDYFKSSVAKILSYPAVSYLKAWDKVGSSRPDIFVAISKEVKKRITTYYGRDSVVIFPPVSLFAKKPLLKDQSTGEYFLVVSRLVSYKRIDLAIQACNRLRVPLKIVGVGSEMESLKKIAGPTISFLGEVKDEELIPLYEQTKALLFPGFEDFGIVMAESLGFGRPVIAFNRGGAVDIVEDGKSGVLFSQQTVESLLQAIKRSEKITFNLRLLRKRAELFSEETFKAEIMQLITKTLQNKKITL